MKIINAKTKLKGYPIYIGAVFKEHLGKLIKQSFGDCEKIVLVTNDRVLDIYRDTVKDALGKCGLPHEIIEVRDGEEYKNLKTVDYIYGKMIEFNMHRNDVMIAFGGGVTGDLAGFAASTFHRGVKFIQCPTTIIGQVDSSIGGKVGVNYRKVKNIIGSFYQPDAVVIDISFLSTLEEEQIINGLGEVVKYGIVFDKKILDILNDNIQSEREDRLFRFIKTREFADIVYRCCKIKSKVVNKDEFNKGYRGLLNFGHTLGHCIENVFGLKEINHGKAVSVGMIMAIDMSISLGLFDKRVKNEIIELYEKLKLPCKIPHADIGKMLDIIKYDKKFKTSKNKFVLLKDINKPHFYSGIAKSIIIDNFKKSMYN
ncbi:MAG: 3-dehydroquinate synthase [Actinomycetota bacterium]|nr:3-dehydroquinate synthase [Actinomycetota bacterium]